MNITLKMILYEHINDALDKIFENDEYLYLDAWVTSEMAWRMTEVASMIFDQNIDTQTYGLQEKFIKKVC